MHYRYIGNEYEGLIAGIFKYEITDEDLNLTNFYNLKPRLLNIVNKYLGEKNIDVYDKFSINQVNFGKY